MTVPKLGPPQSHLPRYLPLLQLIYIKVCSWMLTTSGADFPSTSLYLVSNQTPKASNPEICRTLSGSRRPLTFIYTQSQQQAVKLLRREYFSAQNTDHGWYAGVLDGGEGVNYPFKTLRRALAVLSHGANQGFLYQSTNRFVLYPASTERSTTDLLCPNFFGADI